VSCFFPDATPDLPDQVVLEICIGDAWGSHPTVAADVVWSHPGQLEASLLPDSAPASEPTLRRIEAELPELVDAWKDAIRRGRPAS
jgi:hypothetical protein